MESNLDLIRLYYVGSSSENSCDKQNGDIMGSSIELLYVSHNSDSEEFVKYPDIMGRQGFTQSDELYGYQLEEQTMSKNLEDMLGPQSQRESFRTFNQKLQTVCRDSIRLALNLSADDRR